MNDTQTNTLLVGAVAFIGGLLVGYMLWGNFPGGGQRLMNTEGMKQNVDQHFIVQMIPHHEGAIEMAKIALERSKREEVRSLATGIIEAQEKENADMRAWYKSWFGSTPPAGGMGMGMMHMDSMEGDTEALRSVSDSEFDREFLQQMIPHHEMAIMMAEMLAGRTERDEMKTLANNIKTSQAREIDMMRSWLSLWYGSAQ